MLSVTCFAPPVTLEADVLVCMGAPDSIPRAPPWLSNRLPALGEPRCESWRVGEPVTAGSIAEFSFRQGGGYLFGHVELDAAGAADLVAATQRVYSEIGAFISRRGMPYLLRCWNYIHDIHRGDGDEERYRQFCLGRHRAVAVGEGFERTLPAATVIGTRRPGLQVGFLAGARPGVQVENPRQTPAFRYPREYGPASPSFSRAVLLPEESLLLMSGTASVVGHATRHANDVAAQCEEIVVNVRALLDRAASVGAVPGWRPRSLRVFLRRPGDVERARAAFEAAFGPGAPLAWFEGDICREDLLVEIDGVFSSQGA